MWLAHCGIAGTHTAHKSFGTAFPDTKCVSDKRRPPTHYPMPATAFGLFSPKIYKSLHSTRVRIRKERTRRIRLDPLENEFFSPILVLFMRRSILSTLPVRMKRYWKLKRNYTLYMARPSYGDLK